MPRVNFAEKSYLHFQEISLESLNLNGYDHQENDNHSATMSNRFAISLDDIYDNISLYEYDSNDRFVHKKNKSY